MSSLGRRLHGLEGGSRTILPTVTGAWAAANRARNGKHHPPMVPCDRSVWDGRAYSSMDEWGACLSSRAIDCPAARHCTNPVSKVPMLAAKTQPDRGGAAAVHHANNITRPSLASGTRRDFPVCQLLPPSPATSLSSSSTSRQLPRLILGCFIAIQVFCLHPCPRPSLCRCLLSSSVSPYSSPWTTNSTAAPTMTSLPTTSSLSSRSKPRS